MEEWQARGYVLVAAAINAATHAQRMRLLPLVRSRLAEDRIAVRAMALEAFALLAAREAELRDEALEMLQAALHSSEPAMRARAKLMLPSVASWSRLPQNRAQMPPEVLNNRPYANFYDDIAVFDTPPSR